MENFSSRTLLAGVVGGAFYVAGIATLVGPVVDNSPSEMAASLTVGLVTTDDFTQFGGPLDFYGTLPAGLWSALLLFLLYRGQPSTVSAR